MASPNPNQNIVCKLHLLITIPEEHIAEVLFNLKNDITNKKTAGQILYCTWRYEVVVEPNAGAI